MSSGASGYCRLPIDKQDFADDQKDHPPSYDQVETLFEGAAKMSSGASSQSFFRAPIDREDLTGDQKDHPPTYDQVNPLFKGSYVDEEAALMTSRNHPDCSVSIEGITTYPACQNPPLNSQSQQYPQILPQARNGQQSSRYSVPYQPDHVAHGPPPSYTELQNYDKAKFRSGPPAPHRMQATGQQPVHPAPTANDPRPAVVTYPPSAAGQCIVSQSQVSGGQPRVFVVQPSLENPPSDYLVYSIFVTLCCCWIIGVKAISTSRECRKAIAVGNRRLAEEKSASARNTANAALVLGIIANTVLGIMLWFRII